MADKFAIQAEDLKKIYGSGNTEVAAMQHASMNVAYGEIVALLGPSGSGKSTFLTAVGLINPPTSGRIKIRGQLMLNGPQPMVDLKSIRRKYLGFVFQRSNLIPFLSARENVQIALEINGYSPQDSRKRALEVLNELGMGDRADNFPSMLSGGQQQRVAISRALANQPVVILADEPTAALDSHLGRQVMELFRDLAHKHGTGVIIVTHDQRALDVFDAIYEMEDGIIELRQL
ncbi:MAG: ABC transporter ATP-binding protein [Desulfobacteria bacterium]